MHRKSQPLDNHGVTIVELLVVIVISSFMITIVTAFGLNYWGQSVNLESSQETFVSRLNSGDYLRTSLNATSGLITQNDLQDANVGKADPANATGKYWVPLHAVPSTITMGASGTITPVIYYSQPSVSTSSNFIMNGAQPYEDNTVLYLNGSTKQLLARKIANASATTNRAKTSCPATAASSSCPADIVVSDDVSSIATRYFSRSGNAIDYTSIVDPVSGNPIGPDFPSVEVVELKINYFRKGKISRGTNLTNQTVIRVALRN